MHSQKIYRNISQAYLSIIPLLTALLGFTVHDIPYQVYVPAWIVNACLMLLASWILGGRNIATNNKEKKHIAISGLLLLSPWILYSIFAGMGSPPGSYAEWLSSAFEQQVRYGFLIMGGVLLLLGFGILKEEIQKRNGNIFSLTGYTAMTIAMILFILNMSYWHSFLPETFKTAQVVSMNKLPDWYHPVKKLFLVVSIVEVSLTYLATAFFAVSFRVAGWFTKRASMVYISISLLAFILVALYGFYPESVVANGFPFYPLMIPAIPFVLPFYLGVNLLRKAGN